MACMNVKVGREIALNREAFLTDLALERFFARVSAKMEPEIALIPEPLLADFTLERFIA